MATPGFLDDFDAFMFTRPGGAFNATLSAGAAAQVRAFTRRAVLLNGDFADAVGSDQEIHDLFVSSVLWAAEDGGGYIGELEGATAGLSANGDGQPALNLIAGTAGASQFTGNSSTLTVTAAGTGHPVLDNVTLPHTAEDIEFAAPVTGAAAPRCSPATPATTTRRSSRQRSRTWPCSATTPATRSSTRRRGSSPPSSPTPRSQRPGSWTTSTRSSSRARAGRSTQP